MALTMGIILLVFNTEEFFGCLLESCVASLKILWKWRQNQDPISKGTLQATKITFLIPKHYALGPPLQRVKWCEGNSSLWADGRSNLTFKHWMMSMILVPRNLFVKPGASSYQIPYFAGPSVIQGPCLGKLPVTD